MWVFLLQGIEEKISCVYPEKEPGGGTEEEKSPRIPREKKSAGYRRGKVTAYTPGKESGGVQVRKSRCVYLGKRKGWGTEEEKAFCIPQKKKRVGYR